MNKDLVVLMHEISVRDQKFRSSDMEAQQQLDKLNQAIMDSLFSIYKGYVGSKHVGEKLEYVMWLVVQHSNLEMMKKYLPHVHKAVENGALASTPLKMLLDRVHSIEHKTQIFGSQGGVEFVNQSTIDKVKEKYNLK